MKLGAVTMAYQDEGCIRGTLKCLAPFVDRHIVMLADRPFFGKPSISDRTEEICNEEGVDVFKGFWESEHNCRNIGIKALSDCDWVLHFDSDEMITATNMDNLINILENVDIDALAVKSKCYWKTTDYRYEPYPDCPTLFASRKNKRFIDKRNIDGFYNLIPEDLIEHHHLSWSAPKDILKKVLNYNHAGEFDGQKWYDEVFMKWKPLEPAIEPFGNKFSVVYDPLPEELKAYL